MSRITAALKQQAIDTLQFYQPRAYLTHEWGNPRTSGMGCMFALLTAQAKPSRIRRKASRMFGLPIPLINTMISAYDSNEHLYTDEELDAMTDDDYAELLAARKQHALYLFRNLPADVDLTAVDWGNVKSTAQLINRFYALEDAARAPSNVVTFPATPRQAAVATSGLAAAA